MVNQILPQSGQLADYLMEPLRNSGVDTNHDQKINSRDAGNGHWFNIDMATLREGMATRINGLLRRFDRDHSGTLDAQEGARLDRGTDLIMQNLRDPQTIMRDLLRERAAQGGGAPLITNDDVLRAFSESVNNAAAALKAHGLVAEASSASHSAPTGIPKSTSPSGPFSAHSRS